jgi:ecotin
LNKKITPLALCLLLTASSLVASDHPRDEASALKAFPRAEEGMTRFVIMLPPRADEDLLKMELIIGKTVTLDEGNRYFFGGRLEAVPIPGWGYDYFILKSLGPMAGTLMAVDPDIPKVERFITLGGDPELRRYNSRLPMVIYVPKGVEVRYRIWRGDRKVEVASER